MQSSTRSSVFSSSSFMSVALLSVVDVNGDLYTIDGQRGILTNLQQTMINGFEGVDWDKVLAEFIKSESIEISNGMMLDSMKLV